MNKYNIKITLSSLIIFVFIVIFFISTFSFSSNRNIPNTEKNQTNTAIRGNIITSDNFIIASSKKSYRAEIDTRSLDKNKIDLFLKIFEIYSSIDSKQINIIKERLAQNKNYNFVLLQDIDSKQATYLKELSQKLYIQGFFKAFKNSNGKTETRGLDIIENKEDRIYISKDTLTPIIGYTMTMLDKKNKIFKNYGVKGIEKSYDECLSDFKDGNIYGSKDIAGHIILNSTSLKKEKIDGCDVYINIPLKLQNHIEKIIDIKNQDLKSDEIIVAIMQSNTGKILTLASTRRYDPSNRSDDLSLLNTNAIEYSYEPGSVIKPFIFVTALKLDKIDLNEKINTNNGIYQLGKFVIKDDHKAEFLTPEEVLIYSSNIGMIEIANRLNNIEIIKGLELFGFGSKTGIDLPYEQIGSIPNYQKLRKIEKSVLGYGYGLKTTFIQLLSAYNIFNNNGIYIQPSIANGIVQNNEFKLLDFTTQERILTKESNDIIKNILINAVEIGTGKKALTKGLIIGGKTGTARIATRQGYIGNNYNASFFGFVNDENNSYTIGVLVRNPTKAYSYYSAQSALPIFKDVIDILIKENFLKPKL